MLHRHMWRWAACQRNDHVRARRAVRSAASRVNRLGLRKGLTSPDRRGPRPLRSYTSNPLARALPDPPMTLLDIYRARVAEGVIEGDPAQARVADRLQALLDQLQRWHRREGLAAWLRGAPP